MTSFLPSLKPSGAFHQPSSQFSSTGFKPVTTFIVPPLSPNQSPPKELLVKRNNNKDLGDLLAKKMKTTNCSESGSIQGSPASKRRTDDGGSYENTSPMTEGSPVNMKEILRRINPIPSFDSNQVQFNGLPGANTLFEDETSSHVNNSYGQIQSALKSLQKKMLIHQEIEAQEAKLRALKLHFKLPIPSFPTVLPFNLPKGMSEDPNYIYGDVEFPFLSISTPFSEINQLNLEKVEIPSNKIPQAKIEVEDELDKSSCSSSEDLLSSLLPTREETLRSETEETDGPKKRASRKKDQNKMIIEEPAAKVQNPKKEKVLKKVVVEKEKEKPQPKVMIEEVQEKEKPKPRKDDEASLYRKPVYYSSKRSERQQHRWEAAQEEEKLANSSDDEIESVEVMFGGSKDNQTSIGPDSQVDISMAMIRNKTNNRGKPKMMWDPSSLNEVELSKFFKDVKTALKYTPTEQQMINILKINSNDPQRALKYVKTNKTKCLESFKAVTD